MFRQDSVLLQDAVVAVLLMEASTAHTVVGGIGLALHPAYFDGGADASEARLSGNLMYSMFPEDPDGIYIEQVCVAVDCISVFFFSCVSVLCYDMSSYRKLLYLLG